MFREQITFPHTLIKKMRLSGVGPIRNPIDLIFDPQVNVLVGPNGCGKTTILKQLSQNALNTDAWHQWEDAQRSAASDEASNAQSIIKLQFDDQIHKGLEDFNDPEMHPYGGGFEHPKEKIFLLYIPAIRRPFPAKDNMVTEYTLVNEFESNHDILDYRQVFRNMEQFDDAMNQRFDRHSISGIRYGTAETREGRVLASQDYSPDDIVAWRASLYDRERAIRDTVVECASMICNEILTTDALGEYSHSTELGLQKERGIDKITHGNWRVSTNDNGDDIITIGELSSGTQGPLMWIMHLAIGLHKFFIELVGMSMSSYFQYQKSNDVQDLRDEDAPIVNQRATDNLVLIEGDITGQYNHDEWRKLPFILVIDEIENHLHPTWQRRVIPALRQFFPNVQILATTHSPFVVAGLKAGQVHLLNRDENGVITATTNTEDIVGWTADEILRTYMGVDDPTDDDTASAAAELRKLRDEGPRGDDHAEQERQDRMRELRVAVDTNVLSGPRVAEDERFAATLESILERYRQSTDLNQENG